MLHIRTPLKVVPLLALASILCGAPPQEVIIRSAPQPMPPMGGEDRGTPMGMRGMDGGFRATPMPVGHVGPRASRLHPGRAPGENPTPLPVGGRVVRFYPGTRTVVPPPVWRRRTILPDAQYWQHRDIMGEIQWMARSGFIPVTPIGAGVSLLSDFAQLPAGWRAYGIAVPPGGRIQVAINHPNLGWFRLMATNKWGQPGPGMLNASVAYRPVAMTLTNPGKQAEAIYVIVDDPGWMSSQKDPYTLTIRRDWDPLKVDLAHVQMVSGLWGAQPSVSAEFSGPSLTGPAVYPH